jgi:hypothetical protein
MRFTGNLVGICIGNYVCIYIYTSGRKSTTIGNRFRGIVLGWVPYLKQSQADLELFGGLSRNIMV